jgi:heme/copper-type cytochrome/quinol oxidase subunit 3
VTDLASHSTEYGVVEQEPPSILARNLRVASHIWSSATAFFFVAFLFAYFYLRSLNNQGQWKPKGIDAPTGWGIVIVLCVVASTALVVWGAVDQRSDRRPLWRMKGVAGAALALLAIVFQIVAWLTLDWGPTGGGYASVYFGWTGLYTLFLFGTLYWLETILAVSFRYRNEPMEAPRVEPGHASGDPHRTEPDIANPVTLNTQELVALTSYLGVLAGIGVVTWIVLYLL